MKLHKTIFFITCIITIFLVCGESEKSNPDRLILTLAENPETLDPHKASLAVESDILTQIGASLLDYGPDLKFYPYLAEEYNISEDGKVWSFKLREGILHHDGTPFNAKTYKKNFERAMAPKTASPISGAYLSLVEKIETPTDYELVFYLKTPFLPFAFYLADPFLQPVSETALKKYGKDYGQNPVSVGPFKLKEWQTGQEIILERNENWKWYLPYYENKGKMKFKELSYKIIPERVTTVAALETGKIDIAGIPAEERTRFKRENKFNIFESLHSGLSLYVVMNVSRKPFDDINVRKAVNYAINRQNVIDAAVEGWAVPAYGPAATLMKGYSKSVEQLGYTYNPEEAGRLLEASGWKDTDGDGIVEKDGRPFEVEFSSQPIESWMLASEAVQAQLKNIGISVKISSFELGTLLETMTNGDYDMGLMGYTWTADCDLLYFYYHSNQVGKGPNYSQCSFEELDYLLEKARRSPDEDTGNECYKQVQEYIVKQAIIAPIFIGKAMSAVNRRIRNLKQHPTGLWLLGDVYLDNNSGSN